jgi:NAD(P)H-hydrate repair Nnr-like enzyme with NAD(P)H-hydrate dehydratase domain
MSREDAYWLRQTLAQPLFPQLEWEAPERRDQRGKLVIIGGTKLGFASVASAYEEARAANAGQVRAVVPDALKPMLSTSMDDVLFTASNPSGAFSKEAEADIKAASTWANMLLLIGDAGRNSETAITFEHLLGSISTPCVITRDAIDLLKSNPSLLIERKKNTLVVSFAQLQKLLQSVYFPRGIVFSMHLNQLVEVLHKATLSYPAMLVTYHHEQLVIAHDGRVATMTFSNPMAIWRGSIATRIAVTLMQHANKPFEAAIFSIKYLL